jgi:hypothetical protein
MQLCKLNNGMTEHFTDLWATPPPNHITFNATPHLNQFRFRLGVCYVSDSFIESSVARERFSVPAAIKV